MRLLRMTTRRRTTTDGRNTGIVGELPRMGSKFAASQNAPTQRRPCGDPNFRGTV
jgi:hypothetical protein